MSGTLTPTSSINDARTRAHITLGARLADLDLTQILVYVISNVPESALPALAWQFDVQSAFWTLLAPGASQRQLIQQAIQLHSIRGTPAVLQQIITQAGYPSAVILEGQDSWGGTSYPSNQGWAVFRVQIQRGGLIVTPTVITALIDAINFFRSEARPMDQLQFIDTLSENRIIVFDTLNVGAANFIQEARIIVTDHLILPGAFFLSDVKTIKARYNGHFTYGGGITYGGVQPAVADSGIVVGGVPVV